ncbi:hypothetical protein [Burkholderia sp. RS02]|uniref:hypothetical protein n=1 Tax=unclassified Burkholderia TaxID=2613784 RepID=UPI0032189689
MDYVSEVVRYDAQIDSILHSVRCRKAEALFEAYNIAVDRDSFVAALIGKVVLADIQMSRSGLA